MRHPLMNLVNTTLSQKYGDPYLKVSIYGSVIKSSVWPVVDILFSWCRFNGAIQQDTLIPHTKNSWWNFQKGCQISSQILTFLNCWKPINVHCTGLGCLKAVLRMRLTQLCVCFWLWDAYYVSGISIVGCTTLCKDTIISGYLLDYLNPIIFPCF